MEHSDKERLKKVKKAAEHKAAKHSKRHTEPASIGMTAGRGRPIVGQPVPLLAGPPARTQLVPYCSAAALFNEAYDGLAHAAYWTLPHPRGDGASAQLLTQDS